MKKDGMRVIATVMGESDSKTRNEEVSNMLDYAFAQIGLKQFLTKNSVIAEKELELGSSKIIIVPKRDVNIIYKKSEKYIDSVYDVKINQINLPIKKGDVVGKLYLKNNNKIVDTIDLTVKNDVKKCNIFELYYKCLNSILKGDIKF